MEQEKPTAAPPRPPRGFYPARVDDKGRLKLPVRFQEYLTQAGEKEFFVTTFGRGIARIYPSHRWAANEEFFKEFTDDPEAARRIAFLANAYGADSELDGHGRILLPPELRRKLDLENQPVQLIFFRGRIDIYKQSLYEQQLGSAEQSQDEDLNILERKGLG